MRDLLKVIRGSKDFTSLAQHNFVLLKINYKRALFDLLMNDLGGVINVARE